MEKVESVEHSMCKCHEITLQLQLLPPTKIEECSYISMEDAEVICPLLDNSDLFNPYKLSHYGNTYKVWYGDQTTIYGVCWEVIDQHPEIFPNDIPF